MVSIASAFFPCTTLPSLTMPQEVALRLRSTIANSDGFFYTDLNGLQLVRRRTVSKLPLQGNFYPMPTTALLQDSTHRLSLLAAQPQGMASLKTGRPQVAIVTGCSASPRPCEIMIAYF